MIDGFIVIILVMLGCIGLGVLLGWTLWGNDMKYYKNLAESYKKKLAERKYKDYLINLSKYTETILEKRAKDVLNG